jgi:hypothetical protein
MKVISTSVLWNTWKWFQHWSCEIYEGDFSDDFVNWPFCEIHESDLNIGFCEIHESDFNNGFVKYMKVISAMVLWNTWKWFSIGLWNTWKWFQHRSCEIHESDFSIGLIFQMTNPSVKYTKVISELIFVKYMKVISVLVLFFRWPTRLWNTWKWFQHWSCEIHESDSSIGLIFQVTNLFVKYMKVISIWTSGLMKTFKRSHTCTVEIWFVNRSQRRWKLLLYKRLFSNDLKSHLFIFSNLIDDFCIVYIYFAMSYINILTV